jgi:hypothetical protein
VIIPLLPSDVEHDRLKRHLDGVRNQLGQAAYGVLEQAVRSAVGLIAEWLSRHLALVLPRPRLSEIPDEEGPRDCFKKTMREPRRGKDGEA